MRDFIIVTDSTSDLDKETRTKYGIEYCPMNVVVGVGTKTEQEITADLDWGTISFHDFYEMMRNGTKMKTTAVPQGVFEETFTKALEQGKDVLYIACAGALSGSINIAKMVANELLTKYPEGKIIAIDSLCSAAGEGMMVVEAAKQRAEGKTIEEIAKYTEENRNFYNQFATVETLSYLRNAGRIKTSKAILGNIIGVKPIIISDIKGNNYAYTKVKGRKTSLDKLVEDTKNCLVSNENVDVCITHADCINDVNYVVEKLKEEINVGSIKIYPMGPIIGVSTGPGTIGVYVKGKEITILGE